MHTSSLETIEINLLLEALYQHCGYDFRHYARASVTRRVRHVLEQSGLAHVSELIPKVLHDPAYARELAYAFSITVTEMFRDPDYYRTLREQVVPYLRTYPLFTLWVAGCATGEEIYSLAILLQEEGLYARATIYASDLNETALQKARAGIYPLKDMRHYTNNYQKAGGLHSFAEYYHAEYESVIMRQDLRAHIEFVPHNLVTDASFCQAHLIVCRNVLIYFSRPLQNQVLDLFAHSLQRGGFLCLGNKESLDFSGVRDQFKVLSPDQKIYQKRAP